MVNAADGKQGRGNVWKSFPVVNRTTGEVSTEEVAWAKI